jgi:alkaline phosphatase
MEKKMKPLRKSSYQERILFCFILSFSFFSISLSAQPIKYSVSNAHAHNDYEHPVPFYTAYNAGFGSIEADIIFFNNKLYVAHNIADTTQGKTLQLLYLDPLQKAIQNNKGHVYADSTKSLLLLIDLKTPAEPTLEALLNVLQQYKTITGCPSLKLVITGNQPDITRLTSYPKWLFFDGNLSKFYTAETLNKVALFSDDFRKYARWDGTGILVDSAAKKIEAAVTQAHSLHKPIRFWAAPDTENTWHRLIGLTVDYINTDKIQEIFNFLNKFSSGSLHNK